ncbi:MAG: hypothetical protein IPG72_12695 [Ardenticatenales bacterium]|nr:hypothetical protein [Ardenticatenales bacterium]
MTPAPARGDIIAAAPVTASNAIFAVDMLSGAEGWAVGGVTDCDGVSDAADG